ACGSGSFLLGAYEFLLKWYLDFYAKNEPAKWAKGSRPVLVQISGGNWRLTIAERKRILLDNIFGVDIDAQAVETTKLSLLLKVLEGETQQSLQPVLRMFQERALPDLGNNIKCGNSLIGPDFYEQQQMDLLDDEARYRVNVFDWKDGFPEIFKEGGFAAVIGNPPYVLGRETFDVGVKEYLASHYESFGGKYDLYVYFTEKAVWLTREQGRLGYILPNTLLANENAAPLRRLITKKTCIDVIRTFTKRVFKKAQVESVVIVVAKDQPTPESKVTIEAEPVSTIAQSTFSNSADCRFNIHTDSQTENLLQKVCSKTVALGSLCSICIGIQLGGSSGNRKKESFLSTGKSNDTLKPVLDGKNINRYQQNWMGIYVSYGDWLHRKRDEKYFLNEKILIRQIGAVPIATYDETGKYTLNTIYNLMSASEYSLRYILAIVNSKLGRWFWSKVNSDFKSLFPKIKKAQLESIPIHSIVFTNPDDKAMHDRTVKLVEQMLAMNRQLVATRTPQEKSSLERQISATDTQIDRLVYDLYGLSAEEIAIVEARSGR
ncbi:MAG: Eco57I restriction-modification methylase domain-containing protein, partial [Limisphaerales bacterium]